MERQGRENRGTACVRTCTECALCREKEANKGNRGVHEWRK